MMDARNIITAQGRFAIDSIPEENFGLCSNSEWKQVSLSGLTRGRLLVPFPNRLVTSEAG